MKNIIKESHKKIIVVLIGMFGAIIGMGIILGGSKVIEWKQSNEVVMESMEHIQQLKDVLKEPNSLRLYEGSYKLRFPTLKTTIYLIKYDAKNSYGGYGGQSNAEILVLDYAPTVILTQDDSRYLGLIDGIEGRTSINLEEIEVTRIDTKKLAKKLNCEYME